MTEEILEETMQSEDAASTEPKKTQKEIAEEIVNSFISTYPQIEDCNSFEITDYGEIKFSIIDFTKFNIPVALYNGDLFGDRDTAPYWLERKYLIQDIYSEVATKCNESSEYEIWEHNGYYRVIKSAEKEQLLYNEMTEEEKAEYNKQKRIEAINSEILSNKAYLSDTDYIVTKINEIVATGTEEEIQEVKSQYSEQLSKRKEARVRINELEKELADLDNSNI